MRSCNKVTVRFFPFICCLDEFKKNIVTFEKFSEKPTLLNDSNLVVKIKDTFYSWKAAAPLIVSQLVFQKPLPQVMIFIVLLAKCTVECH